MPFHFRVTLCLFLLLVSTAWASPMPPAALKAGMTSDDSSANHSTETVQEVVSIEWEDPEGLVMFWSSLIPDLKMTILEDEPGKLMLEGQPAAISRFKDMLEQLELPLDTIILECKLAHLSDAQVTPLSVEWSSRPWEGRLREAVGPVDERGASVTCPLRYGLFERESLVPNLLATNNEDYAMAAPRIALRFGEQVELRAGDKLPSVRFNKDTRGFDTTYSDPSLQVFSRFMPGPNGQIHCHLKGRYSLLKEVVAQEYPLVQTVFFEQDIEFREGQSVVIAGLATPEQVRAASQKVPFMGDFPIQGALFRNFRLGNQLYLTITPNLMKQP